MTIYIDADACPVTRIAEDIARKHGIPVTLLCDTNHVLTSDYSTVKVILKKDMLFVNYEAPDGSKRHNRLWNGGNGFGTVKLNEKRNGQLELVDEIEATHIGCEYGEYAE